ncbi:exopolysaccharide Pel transporter PelG [Bradyrhizobium liaoningense]|uniref:exopolysaccharide Pel transporter PelG n=1 Tax=Bradyrhizobium liaoningense TaxID=43992 RepID=UPI001BAA7908|nr:exopolysaccharide Pel transporter PelG [Bradyrhizobium liaoningense]
MTGINVTIEKMTRRGTLAGVFGAYTYAALLVAGPWIFTVLGLFSLGNGCTGNCIDLTIFRSVIIYNSMYALIVTSPMAFVCGRFVAQQVQSGCCDNVFYALILSVGAFSLLTLAGVAPFYIFATTLDDTEKVASIHNAIMVGCSWLLIPFLGGVRAYNAVLIAFGAGAVSMFLFGNALHEPRAATLLLAFNGGFAITNLIMLGNVVYRFGSRVVVDGRLKDSLIRHWELPVAGLIYALGLWIDKIIMWHAAPSGGLVVAGALQTMPSYDTAMFWAQLSSIPIIAVFFVHVETQFSVMTHNYHTRMQQRATLRELNEIVSNVGTYVLSSMFALFAALSIVAGMMILLSLVLMPELGLRPAYMGTLRISLCSMAFYTSAMFCFTFLLHLDLRRPALLIVLTFLVLNAGLTLALLPLGPDFYAYGNMIAAAVSLLVGFSLVLRELSWLHFHAFVTNNPSLSGSP